MRRGHIQEAALAAGQKVRLQAVPVDRDRMDGQASVLEDQRSAEVARVLDAQLLCVRSEQGEHEIEAVLAARRHDDAIIGRRHRSGAPQVISDGGAQIREPCRVAIVGQEGCLTRQEAVDDAAPRLQRESGGVRPANPEVELGAVAPAAWRARETEEGFVRVAWNRTVGQPMVALMDQQVAVWRDRLHEQPGRTARLDVAFGG